MPRQPNIQKYLTTVLTIVIFMLTGCTNTGLQQKYQAAQKGDAQAQYELCFKYWAGIDVPRDYQQALNWCRLSAAQGHPSAKSTLQCLEHGCNPAISASPSQNPATRPLGNSPSSQPSHLPGAETAGWLAEPERDLFAVFGIDVEINGQAIQRKLSLDQLPAIGERAKPPLKNRVKVMVKALEKMEPTAEEKQQYAEYERKAGQAYQESMWKNLARMFSGGNAFEAAANTLNNMAEKADVISIWKMKRKQFERGLAAKEEFDGEINKILEAMQQRIKKLPSAAALDCNFSASNQNLNIHCMTGGSGLKQPLLLVRVFRKPADGKLIKSNLQAGMIVKGMGGDAVTTPEAVVESSLMAALMEKAHDRPVDKSMLLPSIGTGARIDIPFPLDVAEVERIEVRFWSAEGWQVLSNVPKS